MTGVQTCALPIYPAAVKPSAPVVEEKKVIAFLNNYVSIAVIQDFVESILQNVSLFKHY